MTVRGKPTTTTSLAKTTQTWLLSLLSAAMVGCSALERLESRLIFQPTGQQLASGSRDRHLMADVWIEFESGATGGKARLHGLLQEAEMPATGAPVVLYLHGARWDIESSAFRLRSLGELGFDVLGIDYRGFGKSFAERPSEIMAYEDAQAAWRWLAARYPDRPRYIYGHSLGGAIAIDLASKVEDERGTIVEGTFTSIADVFSSLPIGWLPVSPLISQRFAAVEKVANIGSPLLVVHGSRDRQIKPELGQQLFEAAGSNKRFLLVDGGTHRNTLAQSLTLYRAALADLFDLRSRAGQSVAVE